MQSIALKWYQFIKKKKKGSLHIKLLWNISFLIELRVTLRCVPMNIDMIFHSYLSELSEMTTGKNEEDRIYASPKKEVEYYFSMGSISLRSSKTRGSGDNSKN